MPVKATWAHANGWTLVSINYRLTTGPEPARWPDHGDDVADALAYVVNHSAELGVDASRLALIGHSAGGHLVSIVASDPEFTASRSLGDATIDCVVSLDGVGYRLDDTAMVSRSVVASVFGSDRALLESASPATQIERHGAPGSYFLVVSRGSDGNKSVANEFVDLVNAKGGTAEFADVSDYGHNEVNALLGVPDETRLTPVVTDFLRRCLGGVG
jgi:poly(3-hydroxybutyrate) depolymerase